MHVSCAREDGVVSVYDVRGASEPLAVFRTQHPTRLLHATWLPTASTASPMVLTLSQDRRVHAYSLPD
jgi:hypothetical protein